MSRSRSALDRTAAEALIQGAREDFSGLVLLEETSAVVDILYMICTDYPAMLSHVHDANIAATMLAHGVTRLLTHNTKHFELLAPLIEVVPLIP
jgi:hypothetical protein